jgi:photosystem II biogenesis protein Psp29
VDKVRTVSDTKREFYQLHTRPVNSIYRRFVEELMVEIHLLSVNTDFRYDPIFALGVVSAFERFMQGYNPESDKQSILNALAKSVGGDPDQYRQDAAAILESAKQLTIAQLTQEISALDLANLDLANSGNFLITTLKAIAQRDQFKYSRLFAIGLYSLLVAIDPEAIKDEQQRQQILEQFSVSLHLTPDKFQKDLELYRGNLDKFDQLLIAVADTLEADRKKRKDKQTLAESKKLLATEDSISDSSPS